MNKAELRKQYLSKRSLLSKLDVEEGSRKIFDLLLKNIRFDLLTSLHVFLPMEAKNEINTMLLIDRIQQDYPQIKVIVPKVEAGEINSFHLTPSTKLEKSPWGIPEPVNAIPCEHSHIDCVLVPLLAFDRKGNRIGYGKGFYDRFLTTCKPGAIKIGLSLFEAEENIEADSFDVPLDFCVTPSAFYSFLR